MSAELLSDESASNSADSEEAGSQSNDNEKDWIHVPGSCVEYYGPGVNSCGYCKRSETESEGRRSYDMKVYKLRSIDYQRLLDCGWRRSGNYCYHPINASTCCPNYPISCKAPEFRLSKSQRRCIENLNSFLVFGGASNGNDDNGNCGHRRAQHPPINYTPPSSNARAGELNQAATLFSDRLALASKSFEQLKASSKSRERRFVRSCERKMRLHDKSLNEAIAMVKQRWMLMQEKRQRKQQPSPVLEDYLYPKANAVISGDCANNSFSSSDNSNNYDGNARRNSIHPLLLRPKHRLEIHLQHVDSAESKALRNEELALMREYQRLIHKEDPNEWNMPRFCDFLVNSPLITEIINDRDYLTRANETQAGDTYRAADYDDPSEYLLVKPPELPTVFGSYHCTYHLDDKLIAVGVLDILPKCVTTVYFFYDPNYNHLNLGIYSALVEISMVRRIAQHYVGPAHRNKLIYYYMGFYVHECAKMRYKTRFKPSYLLCSETRQYVPIAQCLLKLTDRKYARFADEHSSCNDNFQKWSPSLGDIVKIPVLSPVLSSKRMLDYLIWIELNLGVNYVDIFINNFLIQYVKLVGKSLLTELTLRVNAIHMALVERHGSRQAPTTVTASSDGGGGDNTVTVTTTTDEARESGTVAEPSRGTQQQ